MLRGGQVYREVLDDGIREQLLTHACGGLARRALVGRFERHDDLLACSHGADAQPEGRERAQDGLTLGVADLGLGPHVDGGAEPHRRGPFEGARATSSSSACCFQWSYVSLAMASHTLVPSPQGAPAGSMRFSSFMWSTTRRTSSTVKRKSSSTAPGRPLR